MPRALWISFAATILVLSCASCTQADDSSRTMPATSPPSSSTPGPSASASPSIPPYLEKYTADEKKAYADAVSAYEKFADQQVKILSAGRATPRAKRYYEKYSGDWLRFWNVLRQRESDGVQIKGRGKTLHVRPARIKLGGDGSGSVDIRVCGVSTGVKVFQNGTPVSQPTPTPRIVKVSLFRLTGEAWWRVFLERIGRPC